MLPAGDVARFHTPPSCVDRDRAVMGGLGVCLRQAVDLAIKTGGTEACHATFGSAGEDTLAE